MRNYLINIFMEVNPLNTSLEGMLTCKVSIISYIKVGTEVVIKSLLVIPGSRVVRPASIMEKSRIGNVVRIV